MKIQTVNFDSIDNDNVRVEVLDDDGVTILSLSINVSNMTNVQAKQAIKDAITGKKNKKSNHDSLKTGLEGQVL